MEPLKMVYPGFDIRGKLIEDVQNGIALTREKWEFGEAVAISVSEGDAIRMRDWLISRYPIAQTAPRPTGLSQGWNLVRQCDGFVIGHSSTEPTQHHKGQALADGRIYVPFLVEQTIEEK